MWKQQQGEEEEEGEGATNGGCSGGSSGKAGTIMRIRVENFMCHSNLSVDFSDYVNFITGQNGSGKSAILTALCVAFGIKARGTQRATTLKDFIKHGCTHGLVVVEMKNEGDDAFKPDIYGNKITIERRITDSGNTFALKDSHGKKVASKKDDLQELVDHFNIDVENPCVIMTQDKSREFLHGGSGKEKFKFFYRATLLQQVVDLLNSISSNVDSAKAIIEEMEQELNPLRVETSQLEEKLRIAEHFEGLKQQLEDYKKMLPWSKVYEVDQKLKSELSKLKKCQDRKPACESRIQKSMEALEKVQSDHAAQKATIDSMLEKTEGLRRTRAELENKLSQVIREKAQIEEEQNSRQRQIKQKLERISWLEQQISDIRDRHVRATQAEELEREQNFIKLQAAIDDDRRELCSLQAIESELEAKSNSFYEEARSIREEMIEKQQEYKDLQSQIKRLESQRTNKVTAFGGDNVLRLLQAIERNSGRFTKPPLGPIGAHLALTGDDGWALALEFALGRLLNAFVVTNHKDLLLLRDCAKSCGCHNLQIIIYDFNRPRLEIPAHMLPDRNLLTVMAVIHTEIPTIMNVLIDQGSVERQVLVKDYDVGKRVIFERRNPNVKEAYTVNGTRMFVRGSTQTTLPPDGRVRSGRLCVAVDHQISQLEEERLKVREEITLIEAKKRLAESNLPNCREELQITKRRKIDLQRHIMASELRLREQRISAQAEAMTGEDPNVDELQQEILKEQLEMQSKEDSLEKFKIRANKAEGNFIEAKNNLDQLIESCKGDIQGLQDAENSLLSLEESITQAAGAVEHFRNIMEKKVLPEIIQQENEVARLTKLREETFQTACVICPEQDVAGMDVVHLSSEMIRSKITRYHDKVRREEGRHDESTDQLRSRIHKRKRRLESKEKKLQFYKEKLEMVGRALQLRQTKFQRNAAFLKRQLQWQFNGHLRKKGMSGKVQVDLSSETLVIQVQMPQDLSNNIVKDTRGLSGGERSFSTLCFTLALHEMTEAPFRAMDEFDVFMDAVSRKISLDTLVDFAVSHGSQWIFITPHDISMIKAGSHVKKQQLAAPRS